MTGLTGHAVVATDDFSSNTNAAVTAPLPWALSMVPEKDCSALPDYINDHTFPDIIEITTATVSSIDPHSYITNMVSPCKGINDVPTITSVAEPFDPTNAAKVATVDPTTFLMTVNPTTLAAGVFTEIQDRVFKWEVRVLMHKWSYSFLIPIYVAPDTYTTGCADKKMYPLTYSVFDEEETTYFSQYFEVDFKHY